MLRKFGMQNEVSTRNIRGICCMSIRQGKTQDTSKLNLSGLSIAQIKYLSQEWTLDSDKWEILEKDERIGIRKLAKKAAQQRERFKTEKLRQEKCLDHERKFWGLGLNYVAGVDEVGRGCLAGPVVAAAVILPSEFELPGLDDSKKLSKGKRTQLDKEIRQQAICLSCFAVEAKRIDSINILQASLEAMRSTLLALETAPQQVLVDGHIKPKSLFPETAIVDGDSRSLSIAAASVVAKVFRDRKMCELDSIFPGYGFAENKGYGSPQHLNALSVKGATPEHRKSFAPVNAVLKKSKNLIESLLGKVKSCKDLTQLKEVGRDINLSKGKLNSRQLDELRALYRMQKELIQIRK